MSVKKLDEQVLEGIGTTKLIKLPDGNTVTIRETTGEDDDRISNLKDNKDGIAINKFLSGIIVESSYPNTKPNDILKMKSRVRNYILFSSRVFSLGYNMDFTHTFGDGSVEDLEQDLNDFEFDFENDDYFLPGEDGYNSKKCQPYEQEDQTHFEFTLSSKKKIRMEYLTGLAEKRSLEFKDNTSINTKLIVRKFELFLNDAWVKIERFNMFTSKEMKEVRKALLRHDPEFELFTQLIPSSGVKEEVSLFMVEDFFFPRD